MAEVFNDFEDFFPSSFSRTCVSVGGYLIGLEPKALTITQY
jgi:hypothetical protein